MPPFRDDHILIISPGSQTTFAQLGLPESFTPPKLRIPSRMFPGLEEGTWTFTKIREARDGEKDELLAAAAAKAKEKEKAEEAEEDGEEEGDDEEEDEEGEDGDVKEAPTPMDTTETPAPTTAEPATTDGAPPVDAQGDEDMQDGDGDGVYVEDEDDAEGAVWCIKEGKVVDWGCFFALLTYVHETINPTFHTPILLVHPPSFSSQDKEMLTQFVFEKLKTPGFALLDASIAAMWAYGLSTAAVINVGFEKTDVTPITDFVVQRRARKTIYDCGGESMTKYMASLLPDMKHEDVESLKKSLICEILPLGVPIPGTGAAPDPKYSRQLEDDDKDEAMMGEDEGTINVAAIVAAGKTHEFLAKKDKDKRMEAERKLPNRERVDNTFWVIDKKRSGEEDEVPLAPIAGGGSTLTSPITAEGPGLPTNGTAPLPDCTRSILTSPTTAEAPVIPGPSTSAAPTTEELEKRRGDSERRKQERRAEAEGIKLKDDEIWRELSVGTERFRAAECGIMGSIADALFASISTVEEVAKRADLWDNLIIVGNGAKLKGFKETLVQTITSKYLIPPSSGTIFSSELPSSLSTPLGTGTNTPLPHSQANPLLVAATTHHYQQQQQHHHSHHSSHGQTPMSIKVAKMPEYFPLWKEVGFDEAGFLGAQVAAKVVFVMDQGANRGFMTRVEYNENGPGGIHGAFL